LPSQSAKVTIIIAIVVVVVVVSKKSPIVRACTQPKDGTHTHTNIERTGNRVPRPSPPSSSCLESKAAGRAGETPTPIALDSRDKEAKKKKPHRPGGRGIHSRSRDSQQRAAASPVLSHEVVIVTPGALQIYVPASPARLSSLVDGSICG
jgi:hypothetical protein